jgi:hypothetical protein
MAKKSNIAVIIHAANGIEYEGSLDLRAKSL